MQVFVDDKPVHINAPTLAAALGAARDVADAGGRVIVEATLDGVAIPDELLAAPTDDEYQGSDVRFTTTDPGALVGSTLRGVGEALLESKATHIRAANLIQQGDIQGGVNSIGEALGVWEQVRQSVLNGSALLGVSIETLKVPVGEAATETEVASAVQGLADRLAEVKRSFSTQDWSALADALNYDLPEEADRWSILLVAIADRLESSPKSRA